MKGKKRVIIQNNRVHYEFVIKRNITIIQGDSASGKTTLVNMIRQAENLGESSGINVSCEVPCRVLEGVNWKIILENSRESIFFIDEENYFIKTEEIDSNKFNLIALPIDNEGNSFLEVRFWVYKNSCNNEINLNFITLKCYIYNNIYHCFTKFKLTGNFSYPSNLDYWLVKNKRFKWIIEKLKKDNPEYILAMYELFGFNEEYIRRELGYFKDICK